MANKVGRPVADNTIKAGDRTNQHASRNAVLKLHKGQATVIKDKHRFRVLVAGRRFGKTVLSKAAIMQRMNRPNQLIWYVAPTYRMARGIMWFELMDAIPAKLIKFINRTYLSIELVNGTIIEMKGADNPDCYDDETEILTTDGWVKFKNLPEGLPVMTLNPETNKAEWHVPDRYIHQHYEGPMKRVQSKKLDLLVTPNHKFLVESRKGVRKFKTLDQLSYNDAIPASVDWDGESREDVSDDMAAFMGFYLAEGCARKDPGPKHSHEIVFPQTPGKKGGLKGDVRQEFIDVLRRMGVSHSVDEDRIRVYDKKLWQKVVRLGTASEKRIPERYLNLPAKQLEIMLDWMIKGDGTIRDGEKVLYTTSKGLAGDVQELCMKIGQSANFKVRTQKESTLKDGRVIKPNHDIFCISIYHNKKNYFRDTKESYVSDVENFSGMVHCVEVKNHVVMVRRNGKMCWSGNSLRGVGLDFVVIDEAQDVSEDTWEKVLRPTLTSTLGHALIIGCVEGKTKIMTDSAVQDIESLSPEFGEKTLSNCDLNVYGIDHEFHKADGFYENGIVETKKLKTKKGFNLESSLPHPVLVMDGSGRHEWRATNDVKVGDRIAIDRFMEQWGNVDPMEGWRDNQEKFIAKLNRDHLVKRFERYEIDEDLAYLLGLWVAEGSYEKDIYRTTITCGDSSVYNSLKEFGFVNSTDREDQWRLNSIMFGELLRYLDMPLVKAPFKTLPKWLWSTRREIAMSFIAGMYDGDGCVRKNGEVVYYSASEQLVKDLQLLLTNVGIVGTLSKHNTPKTKIAKASVQYRLTFGSFNSRIFKEDIPLRIERKAQRLEQCVSKYSMKDGVPFVSDLVRRVRKGCAYGTLSMDRSRIGAVLDKKRDIGYRLLREFIEQHSHTSDEEALAILKKHMKDMYFWDTVSQVEPSKAKTFDFTIPDTHSFWSNGFISHNTPKGMSSWFYVAYMKGQRGLTYVDSKGQRRRNTWASWQFPTSMSPLIDPDELSEAKADLDPKSFEQEYEATFVTASGRVYYTFDRKKHVGKYDFNPSLPIWVGMDFNIDPMSAVIMQPQPNGEVWVVDEMIVPNSNTMELGEMIMQKFFGQLKNITIFPDPAGGSRNTSRGESDVQILRDIGLKKIIYKKKHPLVTDRVNAVNRMFQSADGSTRLFVNSSCVKLIEAFERTLYKPGTRDVDKGPGFEHPADALGYCIEYQFPVRKHLYIALSL